MTYNHPFWDAPTQADEQSGWVLVQKGIKAREKSPREEMYIDAVAALYRDGGAGKKSARDKAYMNAMAAVYARYPDDDTKLFYALSILATIEEGSPWSAQQELAARLIEQVYADDPHNPGALHYMIHAYDDPVQEEQGLKAALAYAQAAPAVPHALHMPSHIFTRLGLWEDSISSNLAASAAARKHGDQGEEFHALDYLVYAYLQLGRNDEAKKIRDTFPALKNVKPSSAFKINYAKAAIRARCALEQQHWAEAENLVADPGVQPQVAAISHWAAALGAAHTGNLQAARQPAEQVRRLSAELTEKGNTYWAQQVAIQGEEAGGWVAFAEHRNYDAVRLLRMAADHEDAAEKHSVTPGAVRPARELLGDLLIEMHQPQ
jgi:hypothetical protein